jgi:hypothetical protein
MIGVIAPQADHDVVREFFELFKTPWEFCCLGRRYEVLLCTGEVPPVAAAKLVLVYSGAKTPFDDRQRIPVVRQRAGLCMLAHQGMQIPIYGKVLTFAQNGLDLLTEEDSGECAAWLERTEDGALLRIGYDLFGEVRTLLTDGQPAAQAPLPALELHIALLRRCITGCGIPLVEIPPVPNGYRFIACLTHDVDHPSMRQHRWDHTMFGFLFRAVFGSLRDLIRRRISLHDLLRNWAAALKLPFVHLGLATDPWRAFDAQYLELENGLTSTFFVIPFKNQAGNGLHGRAPRLRAAGYGARDIADILSKLTAVGREVSLHGIDAWCDSEKGRLELEEVRQLTAASEIGVRMHWLYYDQQSPAKLEKAGADYDSTVGYNEAVGYRAGTGQAYQPLGVSRMLELPLQVMDTALFYGARMGLSRGEAMPILKQMIQNAARFGGCLTINWHDRSLAPERLWGGCYCNLLQELKCEGAWFATAGQVVSWFRKRRSAAFETDSMEPSTPRVRRTSDPHENLPGLRLRHHRGSASSSLSEPGLDDFEDILIEESVAATVPAGVGK